MQGVQSKAVVRGQGPGGVMVTETVLAINFNQLEACFSILSFTNHLISLDGS
jgi:hypothetical protein